MGGHTNILNISLNSHIIYDSISIINYEYLLAMEVTGGLQNIEFVVESSNISYDIEFIMNFKVGGHIPIDITNDLRDYDGDTLTDSYENQTGTVWNNPDSDYDGVPDGYDLDPFTYDIFYAHTIKNYTLPIYANESFVRFAIQVKPVQTDYTINNFPFGQHFLKIVPALRIYGNNPIEGNPSGDYLPGTKGNIEDRVSYVSLSPLKDQRTGFLLAYMAILEYNETNKAKDDQLITLKFEIVWLASEINSTGGQTVLHVFDAQQDFIIPGFYIAEIFNTYINVAILGDGLNLEETQRLQPTISTLVSWEYCNGGVNPRFSLQDIPNLHYTSKEIKSTALADSTIEELETQLCAELELDPSINRTYIITQLTNTTKYTFRNWELIKENVEHINLEEPDFFILEIIHRILLFAALATKTLLLFSTALTLSTSLAKLAICLSPNPLLNVIQLSLRTKISDSYRLFSAAFHWVEEGNAWSTTLKQWGPVLGELSKSIAALDIILGVIFFGFGLYYLQQGYTSTGWKFTVEGILLAAAGVAATFFGPWGVVVALILTIILLFIDYFWDGIAAFFHLEDPNPRFDISEGKFGITEFDESMQYSSLTPGSETNVRMSTEINVSGNIDFKFRAQLRIGEGAWGPLVETAQLPPGSVQNITVSDEIEEYGTITSADYYFAAYDYYTNEWISDTITIPLNLTVYPADIATFWQMVSDGSWLRGQQGVLLSAVPSRRTIERGENLDCMVDIYNEAGTPQQFKLDLFESYGDVTSIWVIKYQRIDVYHIDFGYAWHGWYYVPYREQIATQFPFITPIIGSRKNAVDNHYQFGFTLKTPSECNPNVYGANHLLLYAQSITEPDIIQFRQLNYTVTSTRDYIVGITPNTELKVPGENASWAVELHNVGLAPDNYYLSLDTFGAIDPARISLSPAQVMLGPCHTYYIPIGVSIPRTWRLPPGDYLNLTITSQNHPEETYHHSLLRILPFHDLSLNALQPNITIRPGTPTSFEVTLNNSGNVPEVVKASILLDGFNSSPFFSPTSIQIQPGDTTQAVFQLDAAREPLLAPGNYTLHLYLMNEEDLLLINTSMIVTVLEFYNVQLTADSNEIGSSERPRDIYEDRPYIFSVQIKNIGNTPDQFTVDLFPVSTQNLIAVSSNSVLLAPNEEGTINITVVPQVRGLESSSLRAQFFDWDNKPLSENISITFNVIDDDERPPTIFFIDALPPKVFDGEMASSPYYRQFHWTVYDSSGIYAMNASYDGVPVEYQTIEDQTLMIANYSPDLTEKFNMGSSEHPMEISITHTLGNSRGKYSLEGAPPNFLNYFTIDLEAQGGRIYGISLFKNGEEITAIDWDIPSRTSIKFDIAIPQEVGTFQFDVTVRTYYSFNVYYSYSRTFHIQLFATVMQVDRSYLIEIPIQPDDPSTPENESVHNLTLYAIDNDFDLDFAGDRVGILLNRTFQILDDDTIPPEIQITASAFDPDVLLQGVLDLNMTESWRTITDQVAQFGFSRWVSWNLQDASGFSQTHVIYEIEGFDGTIILPERVIFNETETGSPYLKNLVGTFICSLIPGYHRFRVSCSDGDTDWEGDTLSNYKEYVFTITDDDESPLELHNLTINSELVIDAVPMIEVTARVTEPAFARNPDLFQFLVFVDEQWVSNVSVSYEWFYDDSMSPPTFREALVKLRFENIWAEGEILGNHTVEILTVDDDYDILSMDPNPFAQYLGQNYETYRFLHMAENLSFYSPFQGFYSEPLPYSFAGYFFNQSIYYLDLLPWFHPLIILTPYLINLFGFPELKYTILDTNGDIYGYGQGFSPICSAILPTFYAAVQLFFILLHNGVLQNYNIPWSRFNTSSVALSRGTMEILLQHYGPPELIDPLSFTVPAGSFQVLESFDGLLLNYSYAQVAGSGSQAGTYNVSYTRVEGSNFSVHAISDVFQSDLMFEDAQSRVITRSTLFPPNTHTPIRIFPNTSLGETVPIGVDGEGDHLFNVSRLQQYYISKSQRVNAWVLEDLTMLEGIAYYEAATGILLEGNFRSGQGFYYTLKLVDSNLEYIPPPILSTYAPTLSGILFPESGDQLQNYSFSVEYADLDNNAPAYVEVLIDGIPYLMRKQEPSDDMYLDGCVYQLGANLPLGIHNYSFRCSDGEFITTTPTFFGPEVVAKYTPPRETLIFTIYPELLIGTPTLFHTLENGTTVFTPTERLTLTYDLATGIVLRFLLEHIANPTDPTDQNVTDLELILEDTNLLLPYEFLYHNQILPRFIPADAALQAFFTSFEVLPCYELTGSVVPLTCTVFDNESAQWVLNITNIGNIADSYQVSIQNLTLGSATFSQNPIDLLPQASALVMLQVHPLQLGTESFAIFIESLGIPAVNLTLLLQLTVLDDDALPPTISLEYFGDYTDANPGFIRVEAQDPSGLALDPSGDYAVPFSLEPQTFEFVALDNDSDRPGDQLGQTASMPLTLHDDDTTAPLVTNLSATLLESVLLVQFIASDASGIGAVDVTVNGTPMVPISQSINGSSYTLFFANLWTNEGGTYLVELQVTDADSDRPADALTTVLQTTFISIPDLIKSLMLTGLDQLGTLEEAITTINCSLVRWLLSYVVNRADYNLKTALSLYLAGSTTQASLRVWIAKCQMCVSEFIVEIADWLDVLEEDLAATLLGQIVSIQQTLNQILMLL